MATRWQFNREFAVNGIRHLLDTNIVIGLLKAYGPAMTLAGQAGLVLADAAVSQISRMELLGYPRLTDEEDRQIRSFLSACQVCPIDEAIEAEAIRLRRSGAFKLPDAIVAATAITRRCRLLTLDQEMVRGLRKLGHEF